MKLNQPVKRIIVGFEEKIQNKEIKIIINYFENELKNRIPGYVFLIKEGNDAIAFETEDNETLMKLRDEIITYFMKRKKKFKMILDIIIKINLEDYGSFEFVSKYFNSPYDEAKIMCYETKFIYIEDGQYIMMTIGAIGDKEISVDAAEELTDKDNVLEKYEGIVAAIRKVINY